MNWFKFYFNNWFSSRSVKNLTLAQEAIYFRLIIALYQEGGRLKLDYSHLKHICKTNDIQRCHKRIANVKHLFHICDGWITHAKVSEELAKSSELSTKRSESGKKGMDSRYNKAITLQNTEYRIQNKEERDEEPAAPASDFEFHPDTLECFQAWVDFIGLGPQHTAGFFQERNMKDMDASVVLHGKAKVIQCLTSKKVKYPKMVLCQLDKEEADRPSTEIQKRPEGFYEEVEQLSQ